MDYARWLAGSQVQVDIFPRHHGQPARSEAWSDTAVDRAFGGFYSATRETIERGWIRPRFAGYIDFQREGGLQVESHLRGDLSQRRLLESLQAAWARAGVD